MQNGEVFSVFYKGKWSKLYKANEFIAYCDQYFLFNGKTKRFEMKNRTRKVEKIRNLLLIKRNYSIILVRME